MKRWPLRKSQSRYLRSQYLAVRKWDRCAIPSQLMTYEQFVRARRRVGNVCGEMTVSFCGDSLIALRLPTSLILYIARMLFYIEDVGPHV